MRLRKLKRWLRRLFWSEPLYVDEVIDEHVMVTHRGVEITLRRHEKLLWDKMNRKQRNEMADSVRKSHKSNKVQIFKDAQGRKITVKKQK